MATTARRTLLGTALVAVVAAGSLAGASAQAAPRTTTSGTSSISLASDTTASAWTTAAAGSGVRYGDAVSFDTTVGIRASKSTFVYIGLTCFQGSAQVYGELANLEDTFVLLDQAATQWDGGSATCTAYLTARTATSNKVSYETLATTSFDVAPAV